MTDVTTPRELGEFRAWTLPARRSGSDTQRRALLFYEFSLSPSDWKHQPRLIPFRVRDATGGMGSASFRLLRELREENGAMINDPGSLDLGAYLAVTKGISGETFDATKVIFWGYIAAKDVTQLEGTLDEIGSVTALGLGHLMDTIQLSGFRQASAASEASSEILTPPTFNLEGDGGVIIGNKVDDSDGVPVFAAIPSLCSPTALFSRDDVLEHVFRYCKPAGIPRMILASDTSDLIDVYVKTTSDREVFDLHGLTLKGAIDLLIPRSQGLGWKIVPGVISSETRWTVNAYPLLDSVPTDYGTGYPGASATNIDASTLEADGIGYNEDASDVYDEVVIEGDNILIGATPSFADGNLAKGWVAAQETAYRAGAKAATGYKTLAEDEKAARNEEIRNSAELSDVFQLITLAMTSTSITRSATPGTGGSTGPLVPEITWDGTTAAVGTTSRTPYLPSARLARVVPWEIGKKGDGTDNRDAAAKARPEYLKPRVFRYDADAGDYNPPESICADLLVPTELSGVVRPSPTVTPDDRTPGLRIAFTPNEYMALNHWTDGTDGVSRIGTIEQDCRTFDYEKLALTVGIPSDQRVRVSIRRQGVAEGTERARLVVRNRKLQCWVMLAGSIVGTNKDGEADRVAAHTFTRNDFPTAQRIATALAAFAFRKRTSVTLTLAEPDNLPAWASIGTMIGQITERTTTSDILPSVVAEAYTVVESIDYDLRYEQPRVTISTTLSSPPSMSGVRSSPTSGGSVSSALGGTIAQATAAAQEQGRENAERSASVPTHIGVTPLAPPGELLLSIVGGNTLETGQPGVVYTASVASVPSAYDPTVTSSFIDGIGRATLYRNGVAADDYVLVVNSDDGSFRNAAFENDPFATSGAIEIPVSGGGTVRAYTLGT